MKESGIGRENGLEALESCEWRKFLFRKNHAHCLLQSHRLLTHASSTLVRVWGTSVRYWTQTRNRNRLSLTWRQARKPGKKTIGLAMWAGRNDMDSCGWQRWCRRNVVTYFRPLRHSNLGKECSGLKCGICHAENDRSYSSWVPRQCRRLLSAKGPRLQPFPLFYFVYICSADGRPREKEIDSTAPCFKT